jgi:glutathione S-transferase
MPEEAKTMAKTRLGLRLQWVDGELAKTDYLMGNTFTVADAYLFTVSNWTTHVGIDLTPFTNLLAFRARVGARPAVIAAMKAEGLIK